MIVYTGRRGLHIFDIDQEKWIFNSKNPGYMYEDIYFKVRGVEEEPADSSDGTDDATYYTEENASESEESE